MTRWPAMVSMLLLAAGMGHASAMSLREFRLLDANSALARQGVNPLLCVNGRRLEPGMAQSLFRAELWRNSDVYEADMPAPLVMVNALASAYTC
jgi:hypothetical protein